MIHKVICGTFNWATISNYIVFKRHCCSECGELLCRGEKLATFLNRFPLRLLGDFAIKGVESLSGNNFLPTLAMPLDGALSCSSLQRLPILSTKILGQDLERFVCFERHRAHFLTVFVAGLYSYCGVHSINSIFSCVLWRHFSLCGMGNGLEVFKEL